MPALDQVRLDNLQLLVRVAGTLEAVADKTGTTSVYLSQLRNRTPDHETGRPREMGTRMARRLEAAFEKPKGWMDEEHFPAAPAAPPSHMVQERGDGIGHLSAREVEAILALRSLSQKDRNAFMNQLMAAAEVANQFTAEIKARLGVGTPAVSPPGSDLPMRPDGEQLDSVTGTLG